MIVLNKKTIINTVKFASASIISILIAMALDIDFEVSTGIVTILTIQPTKKETVKTAFGRLLAFVFSLLVSYALFGIFGFTMSAFLIYLAIYIFMCQMFSWQNAFTVSPVLISHFLTSKAMNFHTVSNEVVIFVIGVGVGLIANLHLRKNVDYIEELKTAADNRIKEILIRTAERVLEHDEEYHNDEWFFDLKNHIRHARNVAEENYNNQVFFGDIYDLEYIRMRDKQCWILYEMYKSVRHIETAPLTAQHISDFLKYVAEVYHTINTGDAGRKIMDDFRKLDSEMKTLPLPVERNEFEDRARLFGLLRLIEEFIQIKIYFYDKYSVRKKRLFLSW